MVVLVGGTQKSPIEEAQHLSTAHKWIKNVRSACSSTGSERAS